MVTNSDFMSNSKPSLGATLETGVRMLSADQEIDFSLYRRYVFPLDGMNYWIKLPLSNGHVTTAGIQARVGLATETLKPDEAIQVVPGGIKASEIVGGVIVNPLTATDQGLVEVESLFVDFTGARDSYSRLELQPGENIDIPDNPEFGVYVSAKSKGHKFSCIIQESVDSVTLPVSIHVSGSFHYNSSTEQREDATVDSNTVIFTSLSEIQPFNEIGSDYLYIAHYRNITFSFSSRGRLYEQADLYHYLGKALFSVNATQIIDDPNDFNPTLTVSNSLPIWLNMPNYVPPYPGFTCDIPLYPSFLVDSNLPPPFGAVHIEDTETLSLRSAYGRHWEQGSLNKETVKIHLYGVDDLGANDFIAFVEQYSLDWMNLGLTDSPAIVDEKHTQPEMKILAKRKSIQFKINYNQGVSRDIARQFILHAKVQYIPQWLKN